jgi:hypothetical protein
MGFIVGLPHLLRRREIPDFCVVVLRTHAVVLIYKIDKGLLVLLLSRIEAHADLFDE